MEKRNVTVGILAHVDAGKTTLCEAMLYTAGSIRSRGRVDEGSAHMDTHALEKARGITIFSSQARINVAGRRFTLLDTPGHVDFSAEAERSLSALDYAVLVISGTDGVQAHTKTLWRLLAAYKLPVFVFVTKMDMIGADRERVMAALKKEFDACVDFTDRAACLEDVALLDETTLETYMKNGDVADADITALIRERRLFPCMFGSGAKLTGVKEFLLLLSRYAQPSDCAGQSFGARVYKISRDAQGVRLSWLKITDGALHVRDALYFEKEDAQEKVTQLRLYDGEKYESTGEVQAGELCAAAGLSLTFAGQTLGSAAERGGETQPLLEPVLKYRVNIVSDGDARTLLPKLRLLEEEDPMLCISWDEQHREIYAQFMGEVQLQIFQSLIRQRFGAEVTLEDGRILYKETIANKVEGVGHFEPLRHYAEVHVILEPLPCGSGLHFEASCSADDLAPHWQRLILSCLECRRHAGVLTGAPVTDMKITLAAAKAHLKHTEGGDFYQAAARAVRQGLMEAHSVLLEPYYAFMIEAPSEYLGRVLSDVQRMNGMAHADATLEEGAITVIGGRAPVASFSGYAAELTGYTRGRGKLVCRIDGFDLCHDEARVIEETGYNPLRDVENPCDSIFCEQGAGRSVPWDKVKNRMHLPSALNTANAGAAKCKPTVSETEMEAIMLKTVGPIKRPLYSSPKREEGRDAAKPAESTAENRLIIDGYNLLFAWEAFKTLAEEIDLAAARDALSETLREYQSFTGTNLTLVFDAYRQTASRTPTDRADTQNGFSIVYTETDESADVYIAKLAAGLGPDYRVRVVSSDNLIRLAALGSGVMMSSAAEFKAEAETVGLRIREIIAKRRSASSGTIGETAVINEKRAEGD